MKKVLLLCVLGVSLTGCIVAPYDDYPTGRYDQGQQRDRGDRDRHWDRTQQGPQWNNGAKDRRPPQMRPQGTNRDHPPMRPNAPR